MPAMSAVESAFCRSASWGAMAHRIIVPWSLQQAPLGSQVLEIGAGDGAMAARILADHPDISMTVTDVDPIMVAAARQRLARYGARADVAQADATGLPFASEVFGSVVSFLMLHHTLRWELVLGEAMRVLRPGGWLVGYDLLSTRSTRVLHQLDRSPFRLIRSDEIEPAFEQFAVQRVVIRQSARGQVVRFMVQKSQ